MEEIDLYSLMRPRKTCVCKQVSEQEIIQCIKDGATSVEEISQKTLASTGCGTCYGAITRILEKQLKTIRTEK
ncbi:(2Fe-2S)-binding protein [Leptospira sp. GIMC2001]|uniref:(2Fe-2S)-binding protein n=1 Tax=Leptospira sp. GIMC2001 TaxID=1513297 RepID=UPI00234BAE48|nr:(2Fe-2S)-binding protein [Leptospira sp. GIMC2001]WCL49292.1 (2Fe-2S)-binding protein [Leptospira sp. GIMC2001]